MPSPNQWRIIASNTGVRAAISDEDADLVEYTWTFTKGRFVNGYIGYLHRVVMQRVIGEDLPAHQFVIPIDGNFKNCTRENLEIIPRDQWRANRMKARKAPKLATKIIYQKFTDYWRVVADNSLHPTEEAAITHLAHILHKN